MEIMTKKSLKRTDKKGREEIWEWEETPDLIEALDRLQKTEQLSKDKV